eukprot:scaffold65_cov102-Cylindrotheca_fusiformis.AAC.1
MRKVPLKIARALGLGTRLFRQFPIIYIVVAFALIPLIFLGISDLFSEGSAGMTALGILVVILLSVGIIWTVYFCKYSGEREECINALVTGDRQSKAVRDHEFSEHVGTPLEEEETERKKSNSEETERTEGSSTDEEAPAKTNEE